MNPWLKYFCAATALGVVSSLGNFAFGPQFFRIGFTLLASWMMMKWAWKNAD